MIKHYLKNAFSALAKNKFVTLINVFGVSFTLIVITLLFSFFDLEWGTSGPNEHRYDIVQLSSMEMVAYSYDTIYHLDSSFIDDAWVYDTVDYDVQKEDGVSNSTSQLSYTTIKKYLSNLKEAKEKTFFTSNASNVFLPSGKLSVSTNYTDEHYWSLYPHQILEGRYFNEVDVQNNKPVMVITEKLAEKYFGKKDVVGQVLEMSQKKWHVIGVVKNPREYEFDCFVPYTHLATHELNNEQPLGRFVVSFLTKDKVQVKKLKEELETIEKTIAPYEDYTDFFFYPTTFREGYAAHLFGENLKNAKKSLRKMRFRFSLFGFFFLLLPVLNLLNINLSRVFERRSEIGIRKAFGAGTKDIFLQFLFESVLLSLVAGLLAMVASYFLIHLINHSEILDNKLILNSGIVLYGMLAAIAFGFLFGVLPATTISQLSIVKALKN